MSEMDLVPQVRLNLVKGTPAGFDLTAGVNYKKEQRVGWWMILTYTGSVTPPLELETAL